MGEARSCLIAIFWKMPFKLHEWQNFGHDILSYLIQLNSLLCDMIISYLEVTVYLLRLLCMWLPTWACMSTCILICVLNVCTLQYRQKYAWLQAYSYEDVDIWNSLTDRTTKVKLNCCCVHWPHQLPTTQPDSITFSKPLLTFSTLVLGRLLSVSACFPWPWDSLKQHILGVVPSLQNSPAYIKFSTQFSTDSSTVSDPWIFSHPMVTQAKRDPWASSGAKELNLPKKLSD
jgi:hypothetical protein